MRLIFPRRVPLRRRPRTGLGPALLISMLLALAGCNYESGQRALDRGEAGRAAEIWQPLADLGDTRSAMALGRLKLDGDPTPDALDAARENLLLVSRRGETWQRGWAEYDLGRIALMQDESARAAAHFETALLYDIPWAAHTLGQLLLDGNGVRRDTARALDLFTLAANQDIAPAMTALGNHYASQSPPDRERAQSWYRQAAGRDPWADYGLGRLIVDTVPVDTDRGDGPRSDIGADAHLPLERAAEAGLAPAQRLLGDLLLPLDARHSHWGTPDPARAVSLYQQAAEGGDIWAHLRLGNLLRDGDIVARDPAKAAEHYTVAADADIPGAHAALARLFEFGDGVPPDRGRAIQHYRQALELGETGVQDALDRLLQGDTRQAVDDGDDARPSVEDLRDAATGGDASAAFELAKRLSGDDRTAATDIEILGYLRQAVDGGVTAARKPLADALRDGPGDPDALAEAAALYRRAAEAGDRWAEFDLARLHLGGGWPEADSGDAIGRLEDLAEDGMAEAAKLLGDVYDRGDGVDADPTAALAWHQVAAEIGHQEVLLDLARRYEHGHGTAPDRQRALSYYRQAAEHGLAPAQRWLADHLARAADGDSGETAARSLATALEWYREAASRGDAWSLYRLGHFTLQGKGVDRDADRAVTLLEQAAEAGSAPAAIALGDLYTVGGPVDRDPEEAARWYRQAGRQNADP